MYECVVCVLCACVLRVCCMCVCVLCVLCMCVHTYVNTGHTCDKVFLS